MIEPKEIKSGFDYFVTGWHLITRPGLRRFVIMPILLNIVLMIGLFWLFISQIGSMIDSIMAFVPDWLSWLSSILFIFSIGMILLLFYFAFTTLSGFIAAPFNGLLAEKVEKMLTNESLAETGMADFIKDIPRMLGREWQKLIYSLPKFIGLFLLSFIPLVGQTVIPVLTFLFTAWMMSIQYCDYPFDNHKISFHTMRFKLAENRSQSLTFGTFITSVSEFGCNSGGGLWCNGNVGRNLSERSLRCKRKNYLKIDRTFSRYSFRRFKHCFAEGE